MGKYMRKSKGSGGVALMETQPSLGVRTRAKTLALKRLQQNYSSSSAAAAEEGEGGGGGSYLQLRSRRLEKVSLIGKRRKLSQTNSMNLQQKSPTSRLRLKGIQEKTKERGSFCGEKVGEEEIKEEEEKRNSAGGADLGIQQTSFGENVVELEGRERTTRESTPCSLIRDADAIRTPESSTRPSTIISEIPHNRENLALRQIPASQEMEAFFSGSEELQQRKFVEKYNYDPVTDQPLPGRFEWEKLKH